VEKGKTIVTRQRRSKHVSAAIYTDAKIEEAVFSIQCAPVLYNGDHLQLYISNLR
jgi:hypothetical protein